MTLREAVENAVESYSAIGFIDNEVRDVRIALKPVTVIENGVTKVNAWLVTFSCEVAPF